MTSTDVVAEQTDEGAQITASEVPVLLWEGQAAMFQRPDGGRVIRYEQDGEEKFIALPAALVPALMMLAENPGALDAIAAGPMGGVAKRMAGKFARQAAAHAAGQ
jgi:hypothetical protein